MGIGQGWRDLDRILRGEATRLSELRRGTIEVPIGGLAWVLAILAMVTGACMGSFAIFRGSPSAFLQVLASMLKVPLLFGLTLIVTFPSLYVFNTLVGSRLGVVSLLRLLLASLGVTIALLASLGPIVAFFSASTTSYAFMQLLNVGVFAVSGFMGMAFLLQTLHRLSIAPDALPARPVDVQDIGEETKGKDVPGLTPVTGALEPPDERGLSRHVRMVFRWWILLFGMVGAQMGWVLRPFIGDPNLPFAWFRAKESNIFVAVLRALGNLMSGQ